MEQKKEENILRYHDANTNKFKEDVKYDNFKRHIIKKHSVNSLQVQE